ncbi:Inversin-B [Pseudolycoriella hygida]|uniref:Inversin-B n=1 Tax=Pseudolycoriella hygida TaxID=35572 RepID=A0A9Q0NDU6_9DIPT|nr:Inversin-B [Pseudolycoriella hygida]
MSKVFYKYHNRFDNSLHKAAFRGKVDKINSLLTCISPYKTTFEAETPLHLSISKGHQNAINIFLHILETDLTAMRQFLNEKKINIGSDQENFAFAFGKRQIDMVEENCNGMIVNWENGEHSADKCSFILMKETIHSVPAILVVRPNNQAEKFLLLSTVFDLLKVNGVISLNVQRASDLSTILHLAAAQGNTELVVRLLNLGANPYLKDKTHQTAIGVAHTIGEFPTYVAMCRHLHFNMLATNDLVRLPVKNGVWEKVEFLIETLVSLRMEKFEESRDEAIETVLSMNEISSTLILSNIGEKCLEKYGQFLSEEKLAGIITYEVKDEISKRKLIVASRFCGPNTVQENSNRMIQHRSRHILLHTLIRTGCRNTIHKIYRDFPRLKTLLFEHKELGLTALIQCIRSNHVELAQFLIDEHEHEIDRPEMWSKLLITAAGLHGSTHLMQTILEHRLTDPNLVIHGNQSIETNALFACIEKGDLEKVKVILDSSKLKDVNSIRTEYETLLMPAIISMKTSPRIPPSNDGRRVNQFKYLTNNLDTSEDEDETVRNDPYEPNDDKVTKYTNSNKIFDLLIERGINFKDSQPHTTLLCHAVKSQNKYIVERLVVLGFDPIVPDAFGFIPLHYVNDMEIFNILKNHKTFANTITVRNKLGLTALHFYVRDCNATIDLCSELLTTAGIDVNALDASGNTPLHNAAMNPSISISQYLIDRNANINLKNAQGYTAAHIAIKHRKYDIAALLFRHPLFDLFSLTNSDKSYLVNLSGIADGEFEEIKIALESRKDEFNRLIELHCNEVDDFGYSLLYLSSMTNKYLLHLLIAQPQISVYADTNVETQLLHRVGNDVKFAKFLVEKGLCVNKVDRFFETPLVKALKADHGANIDVVKCLIASGANVNYTSWQGTSPLRCACIHFDLESIKILLEAGADFNVKDIDGKIPFDCLPIEYRNIVANIIL